MTMTTPTPKRRFRFSLRTMLVATAVACIVAALVGVKIHQVQRQRRAVEAIGAHGGEVVYDYQLDANGKLTNAKPPGPGWFRKLAGDDFFAHVVQVDYLFGDLTLGSPLADLPYLRSVMFLEGGNDLTRLADFEHLEVLKLYFTPVSDISPVASLSSLEQLVLQETLVSDLRPLSELQNLRSLRITGNKVRVTDLTPLQELTGLESLELTNFLGDDLAFLANLKNLESLRLGGRQVEDLSALRGLSKLAELKLWNTQVTDLSPLAALPKLRYLEVDGTLISDQEVEELQRALPELEISQRLGF